MKIVSDKPSYILKNRLGVAAIEFAIILPLFILLLLGVIDLGIYFLKSSVVSRSVSVIANAIQKDPGDDTILLPLAQNSGVSYVNYSAPNYICAQSYATQAAADTGLCKGTTWNTKPPVGVPVGGVYYVAVAAYIDPQLISPFSMWFPDITVTSVIQAGGAGGLPVCGANQALTSTDGKTFKCVSQNFGGAFMMDSVQQVCVIANPFTGGCTCPSGYAKTASWSFSAEAGGVMDGSNNACYNHFYEYQGNLFDCGAWIFTCTPN